MVGISKHYESLLSLANRRVTSGVLQLTLGIGLIIAVLCGSMILLVYYARLSFLSQTIQDKLNNNASSGIQYLMAMRENIPYGTVQRLDFFHTETDTVELYRKPWGLFDLVAARAAQGRHEAVKAALLAANPNSVGEACLYIPKTRAITYLIGNATIKGNAFLPDNGLTPGFIDGTGFRGDRLLHGDMKKSDEQMPPLDTTLLHFLKTMFHQQDEVYHLRKIENVKLQRQYPVASSESNYYYSDDDIELSDSLSGNLIIHSATKVIIASEAWLKDILVIAPEIYIQPDFTGSVQCFASRYISVGEGSKLAFPSALGLIGMEEDSMIVIAPKAVVEGVVVIPGYNTWVGSRGVFKIEKGGLFHGMAFVNGAGEIEGSLWGHLTLRSFQCTVGQSIQSNYFRDGTIDGPRRSTHMPASLLWGNDHQWVVAKWMK